MKKQQNVPSVSVQLCRSMVPVLLGVLSIAPASFSQDKLAPSVIIEIKNPAEEFAAKVDQIGSAFEAVGEQTDAWTRADAAAKDLASDPDNATLKRRAIASRADLLDEKIGRLRSASDLGSAVEQAYRNYTRQIDAEVQEAKADLAQTDLAQSGEVRFLSQCLEQLVKLESATLAHPVRGPPDSLNESLELSDEDKEQLAMFQSVVDVAELQLENARNANQLSDRRLLILTESRIQAAREYLAIRKAVSMAKQDQIAFIGIARNDLTYLKLIDSEERLAAQRARKPLEYPSGARPSFLRGGYRFGELTGTSQDDVDQSVIANGERIRRIQIAIGAAPNRLASSKDTEVAK